MSPPPRSFCFVVLALACAAQRETSSAPAPTSTAPVALAAPPPAVPSASAAPAPPAAPTQLEPDGSDDETTSDVSLPERLRFEKVGRHWAALTRVCDAAVLGDALYLAHATQPLGLGGASVTRYRPDDKTAFSLAFNWNREGEPEKGGGAGQGFLRVRAIDGRLYVPDADPPYLGLGLATGIEGYVFASDAQGSFAAARNPGHLPPRLANAERAGSHVLPGVLHGFDVIRFRGRLYGSSSAAIPPNGNARSSPGTLLTPGEAGKPWQVAFTYAGAQGEESVRLSYMVRFRDRLYVAISPLYGFDAHDFLVIAPARDQVALASSDARAVQVTPKGGAHTLRWYTDRGRLYWLTIGGGSGVALWVSDDGEHFRQLPLPAEAGAPSDLLRVGQRLLVLAERGLYELEGDAFHLRASVSEPKTPFPVNDGYCAAPLVLFRGELYAGDQLRGNLWKLAPEPRE